MALSGSAPNYIVTALGCADAAQRVDALDKFALDTGRFLRYNPMARLLFLVYLIMLHLWALVVLAFHSHNLEKMHADTGGQMKLPGAPP